jgi:two-component system chemotaxis sensor kinase CheA
MSTIPDEQIGEVPLDLKADVDTELVEEFISDAREQLELIEQGALALEKNGHDAEGIHTLFRAFHTFKGNAGFLELTAVSSLAHMLESLLEGARENRLQINSVIVEIILKSRDTLQRFVDEIEAQITGKKPRAVVHIPTAALKATVKFMIEGGAAMVANVAQMKATSAKIAAARQVSVTPPADAPAPTAPVPVAPETPAIPAPAPATEATPASGTKSIEAEAEHGDEEAPAAKRGSSNYVSGTALHAVKVNTNKLDGLVDLTGELLIAQSLIVQSVSSPNVSRHIIARNLDQLTRISKELQRTAMSMRMVPIRATLHKMQRLARDLAARQDKKVQLVLEGEDTEVDRTVVEKLSDPLAHMIRNAVDHGIEEPDARVDKGKPSTGTISIRAYHKSGNIVIEVCDDGQGLNPERIKEKAISLGFLHSGASISEKDLLAMILRPGFSTAAKVTNISGRGVGMDVVYKNVSNLRGKIEIKSTPGQGTTFTLRLPLTLAIIDGLIIGVGGQRYVLPTHSVAESFHPKSCRITTLPGSHEVVEIRKEMLPLLRLRDHFQIKDLPAAKKNDGILIVIESDGKRRCLLADELVGKQEIVIKNLGEVFRTDPMVSGGAILGNGCVGLILDPGALVNLEPHVNELQLAT